MWRVPHYWHISCWDRCISETKLNCQCIHYNPHVIGNYFICRKKVWLDMAIVSTDVTLRLHSCFKKWLLMSELPLQKSATSAYRWLVKISCKQWLAASHHVKFKERIFITNCKKTLKKKVKAKEATNSTFANTM